MNSQRQGTICLLLGLLALSIYLGVAQTPERGPGSVAARVAPQKARKFSARGAPAAARASASSAPVDAPAGWVRTYRGDSQRRCGEQQICYDWQVDVYGLPVDASGGRFLLLHSCERPRRGWDWFEDSPGDRQTVVLLRESAAGRVRTVPMIGSWPLHMLPIDLLLLRPPLERSPGRGDHVEAGNPSAVPARGRQLPDWCVSSYRGAEGSEYRLDWEAPSDPRGLYFALSSDQALPARVEGVRRRCRLGFDALQRRVEQFEVEAEQCQRLENERFDGALSYEKTRALTTDEIGLLRTDAEAWQRHLASIDRLLDRCAEAVALDSSAETLERLAEECEQWQPPVASTHLAIRHRLTRLGFSAARELAVAEVLRTAQGVRLLQQIRGGAAWPEDLKAGPQSAAGPESAAGRAGPCLVAVVCRSAPCSGAALRAAAQLRRDYRGQRVRVRAVATDYFHKDVAHLEACSHSQVPLVTDSPIAERLQLAGLRVPVLVILDAQGKVCGLYPWHGLSDVEPLRRQLDRLLSRSSGVFR